MATPDLRHRSVLPNVGGLFNLHVSRGLFAGHEAIHKFGRNDSVGTTLEFVGPQGSTLAYPSSATVLKLSSDDAADTSAGTGLRTLQLYGCDGAYTEINETVTLNGQTEVNTVNSYLRVWRAVGRTAGSGGANAGEVYVGDGTVTSGVPATIYIQIPAGVNQSLHTAYTVPANKTLYVDGIYGDVNATKGIEIDFCARPENEIFQTKFSAVAFQAAVDIRFACPLKYDEKTDIEIRALVSNTTAAISAGFFGILLDDVD